MKVLIVCGAGASSTFVAQRLRRAAAARDIGMTPIASSAVAAPDLIPTVDIVLAGAHLGAEVEALRAVAASSGVPILVLDDAARQDGDELLDTTLAAAAAHRERTP
jgi:PTS system cellobiose-specific IIB component